MKRNKTLSLLGKTAAMSCMLLFGGNSIAQEFSKQYTAYYPSMPTTTLYSGNSVQVGARSIVQNVAGLYNVQTVKRQNNNTTDILITRHNTDGDVLWRRTYGTYWFNEAAYSIIEAPLNRMIIVGDRLQDGTNYRQNFAICIDAAGNVIWKRVFGEYTRSESSRVITRLSGTDDYIVVGHSYNNVVHDKTVQAYRISADGTISWFRRYEESTVSFYETTPTTVVQKDLDEVMIMGHIEMSKGNPKRLFSMMINPANGELFSTTGTGLSSNAVQLHDINSSGSEEIAPQAVRTPDLSGFMVSFNVRFPNRTENIGLLRMNNTRNISFASRYSLPATPFNLAIQRPEKLLTNGVEYHLGLFLSQATLPGSGGLPGLLRLNMSGNFVGAKFYRMNCTSVSDMEYMNTGDFLMKRDFGPGSLKAFGLSRIDNTGDLNQCDYPYTTITRTSMSRVSGWAPFGSVSLPTSYIDAVLVIAGKSGLAIEECGTMKKEVSTTVEDVEQNNTLKLYPNPTNGEVTIQTQFSDELEIEVNDQLGRTVLRKTVSGSNNKIDLSGQSKGIYFVKIKTGENYEIKKLILE